MGTESTIDPQKAWARLGTKRQREVRKLAAKRRLHPDASVRATSVAWARDFAARRKEVLFKEIVTGLAAAAVTAGLVYLATFLMGLEDRIFPRYIGLFAVLPFAFVFGDVVTAGRVAKIAEGSSDE